MTTARQANRGNSVNNSIAENAARPSYHSYNFKHPKETAAFEDDLFEDYLKEGYPPVALFDGWQLLLMSPRDPNSQFAIAGFEYLNPNKNSASTREAGESGPRRNPWFRLENDLGVGDFHSPM